MARFNSTLDNVKVAAPCNADWDAMIGNDRSRFCGQCNLNVYNLSSMTRPEAESFIARSEGRVCVRFYRRGDGSILTKNCPVGLRALRRRISYVSRAVASTVLSFFAGLGIYQGLSALSILDPAPRYQTVGVMAVTGKPVIVGPPVVEKMPLATMGDFAIPIPADIKPRPKRARR